jgi:YHS domain-containing protein
MPHHAICPVSGLPVENPDDSQHIEYEGMQLFFCCISCEDTFLKDPRHYLPGNGSYLFTRF